jgi:long-chain acyl-CoA synthetase
MSEYTSLPHALRHNAQQQPDAVALRFKDSGIWRDISWAGYWRRAQAAGAGLRSLGLEPGDMVAMVSTNRVEWLVGDLGTLAIGCVSVPVYPSSIADAVAYVVGHCGAKAVFVEDAEQARKIQEFRAKLPELEHVIAFEPDGIANVEGLISWDDLLERGHDGRDAVDEGLAELDEAALATIIYTSGTTGPPKGAMISHRNMMAMAESLAGALEAGEGDSSLSFLPLSHVAERLQGQVMAIRVAYTVNMGEGLPAVAANLVEVEPTILVCVPRLWEKYYARIQSSLEDAPTLRRKLFDWATGVGLAAFHMRSEEGRITPSLKVQLDVADRLVLSKLRKKLGMGRGRKFLSGAAPLSAEVGRFFASLGIVIQEVYGQTECVGVCTFNPTERPRFGTVGIGLSGMEVRIAEDGEIMVKGPNVFMGYLKNPEATAETVVDGWLATGDVGVMDEQGYVRITDRKKDIIVTAGGKNVSPQNIENRIKTFPGISQAVVVGDKRKFLSALITLDREGLEEIWGRQDRKLPVDEALPDDDDVKKLLRGYVDQVNGGLSSYETVKKFAILPRDFTVEDGELTPSLKVKRRVIQRTHVAMIDAFYGEKFD